MRTDRLARIRARGAQFGARTAGPAMKLGASQHEVRRGDTHLAAIQHDADMRGFGVAPSQLQAVIYGFKANAVTIHTILDAPSNILFGMRHGDSPRSGLVSQDWLPAGHSPGLL